MGRRLLRYLALVVAGFSVLIGVEVVMALARDYPFNGPEKRIRGNFGDPSLPRIKFVVLGDSTSIGVGTSPENSFPWLLAEWLGRQFHVELEVLGAGGATTKDVAESQVPQALTMKPDLVLIEIGANDVTHVSALKTVRSKMAEALDRLAAAQLNLVVAGPPHMGTSRAFAQPLRALSGLRGKSVRRTIESEVTRRGIPYIDLSAGTHDEFDRFPSKYYSDDWFHPGKGGYRLWAEVMYPTVLEAALETRSAAS